MSKRKKYILLLIIAHILPILIYVSNNFNGINYHVDTVKSFFYYIYELLNPQENNFRIIDPLYCKKYNKTYNRLPEGFIHSGHMLFYKAKNRISLRRIAEKSIVYTHFYRIYKLERAIKEFNGIINNSIKRGMVIYIPYSLPILLPDIKRRRKPEIKYIRGLYFTGNSVGSEMIWHTIRKYRDIGINAIVFDAKDITGIVNYFSYIPDVREYNVHEKRTIDDIDKLIRILREINIYTIARISVFRDQLICKRNPNFAIRSKSSGGIWNARSKELWCDPTNKFVQDYNIALAIELAERGVDEIQFDYIRFPTVGDLRDAGYKYHFGEMSNEDTISLFLKRAYNEISKRNTLLSIDIFGVVAWGKMVDIRKTGQKVELLSRYCDIISPMLYPSHFADNFDGFEKPGDNPYYFIYNGCKRLGALSGGKTIRPWIQAFKWRTTSYDEAYILEQIKACENAGTFGYMFWNSKNKYEMVYKALSRLAYKSGSRGFSLPKRNGRRVESLITGLAIRE